MNGPPDSSDGRRDVDAVPRPHATDPRMHAAWREWLMALASDAEAALATADVYQSLSDDGRNAWLDALVEDAPTLTVPPVALYAPLISVEMDLERRARMIDALSADDPWQAPRAVYAVCGSDREGARLVALVRNLYLDFVEVLLCRHARDRGFSWVRHDPFIHDRDAPHAGSVVDGVALEPVPIKPAVEELAHAILAHRRTGEELPAALASFADVFDAPADSERCG